MWSDRGSDRGPYSIPRRARRVLRDYPLYAATRGLIRVRWSVVILEEVVEHLIVNLPQFTTESGARLVAAMNGAFPNAEVTPSVEDIEAVETLAIPDEDDRHVLAAAIAAEADVLCTDNVKHFPPEAMAEVGIEAMTADDLLSLLIEEFGDDMLAAHRIAVSRLPGATDESTIAALRRANATRAADLMASLLDES